jgi:hypothetical protein
MALETRYEIGSNEENGYPVVHRIIVLDGVEVSRGEPLFAEVKATYPQIIEEYFNAVASWAHELADYFDTQTEFTAENYVECLKASRFFFDFDQKFNYAAYANDMPHLQAGPAVVTEETPESPAVEETPDTE